MRAVVLGVFLGFEDRLAPAGEDRGHQLSVDSESGRKLRGVERAEAVRWSRLPHNRRAPAADPRRDGVGRLRDGGDRAAHRVEDAPVGRVDLAQEVEGIHGFSLSWYSAIAIRAGADLGEMLRRADPRPHCRARDLLGDQRQQKPPASSAPPDTATGKLALASPRVLITVIAARAELLGRVADDLIGNPVAAARRLHNPRIESRHPAGSTPER